MSDSFLLWLTTNEIDKYHQVLVDNDINTIDLLKTLTTDDLKELGVSLGDRKRFGLAIEKLASQADDLSEADLLLINSLPYVIAYPLKRTLLEKHPWTRLNLFKDTFLNYLKYMGLITASEFFNSSFQDKKMVALFYNTLSEPSFGTWNVFIREALKFLNENSHQFFCPELNAYYEQIESAKKRKLYKGEIQYIDAYGDVQHKNQEATAIGMLINFRNRYLGHGLTLDEATSIKLWEEYYPIFNQLLNVMVFTSDYLMYKHEHGETYSLQSAEIRQVEAASASYSNVWLQNKAGNILEILPFFIVPGEVNLAKGDKEQILTYESYTGKTMKFFSPEGTEKQTSGNILERLNLLLRNKQKEQPYIPETFTREVFLSRIADENKLISDTLVAEKKIIPRVYVHRQEMETKLKEWVGARASIFFMAAEAGSGKTNLLMEMQKQYAAWGLNSLFIRAGRMEKPKLTEQIAYLLNIDSTLGLSAYPSIAGTQSAPTFILIDGLNEAFHAEELWKEVLELSQLFEPGSLKFVVTSRANTAADLGRYPITDTELNLVYGEKKERQEGLAAFTFWLTVLNMEEMKVAWENYAAKDKLRYKPLFSFEDIAIFDRAIYDQINNPLVLRIFLEVYNGKNLPKKGKQHLKIWQDWLQTFSLDEQRFLGLLATEIWNKGDNELLLDDLLKLENLKPYLVSDNLNSPYQRLKNLGWVSRYVKDVNVCIGFTIEGALLYLLGVKLQKQEPKIDLDYIQTSVSNGTKLQQSSIESFLCEQSLTGDLDLVTALIDAGTEQMDLCIRPLLFFMKAYGVEATINKVLEEPTDNDWKILKLLNEKMNELQVNSMQILFSNCLLEFLKKNNVQINISLLISILPMAKSEFKIDFISKIENAKLNNEELEDLAFYFTFNGFPKKAVSIYENLFDYNENSNPLILNKIASAYYQNEESEKAKSLYLKAMDLALRDSRKYNSLLAMIYYNLATVENSNTISSIEYLSKSLNIELQLYGEMHSDIVKTYLCLAKAHQKLDDLDSENAIIQKVIKIYENGIDDYYTNTVIGGYFYSKKDYKIALKYYTKAFNINLFKFGSDNFEILEGIINLSYCNIKLENYEDALSNLLMAKKIIDGNGIFSNQRFYVMSNLANVYDSFENYEFAISIYAELFQLIENDELEEICSTNDYYSAVYWYAQTLYNNNQFNESLKLLNELPDEIKNRKKYLKLISDIYYCINDYALAIECYKKIMPQTETDFEKISICEYIAASYQFTRKFELAISNYLTIIDLAKNQNSHEDIITSYFRIGYCYSESKIYKSAIDYFKLGLELSNRDYFIKHIAESYDFDNNQSAAFENYLEYASRIKQGEKSDIDEELKDVVGNIIRISKLISRESELPDWIKNYCIGEES